jgi:hypothetical protein
MGNANVFLALEKQGKLPDGAAITNADLNTIFDKFDKDKDGVSNLLTPYPCLPSYAKSCLT